MFEIKLTLKSYFMLRKQIVTGINEILVLVLLIACILILPRLFKKDSAKKVSTSKKIKNLSAKIRFSIVLTLVYPIVTALYLKPWENNPIVYLSYGVVPVFLVWAIAWVVTGKKKKNER
jgi:Na+/H+ antiporter NhaD/arsenite permease-like protein